MRWGHVATALGQGIGPEVQGVPLLAGTGADVAHMLRDTGHAAIAVDEHPDELDAVDGALSGAAVLSVPRVAGFAREHCDAIVPFKTSPRLELVCRDLGLGLLAAPARLVRQLENKLQLPGIADGAAVRSPATRTVRLDDALVDEARRGEVALPAVYQPAVAFAGAGTRLVRDAEELATLVASGSHDEVGKLCEHIAPGTPTCVTGVVLDDGTVLAGPVCLQLTGIAECTDMPFGSCGNDWSLDQAGDVARAARACALATGAELARRGLTGTFGADIVVDAAGDAVLVEVNPRITASLGLQVQLQQLAGQPTLLDAHVLALAPDAGGLPGAVELHDCYGAAALPVPASACASVIVFHRAGEAATPSRVASGGWRLAAGDQQPARIADAWRLEHLLAGGAAHAADALLFTRTHLRASRPHAELARLVLEGSAAAAADGRSLAPHAAAAVAAARSLVAGAAEPATA